MSGGPGSRLALLIRVVGSNFRCGPCTEGGQGLRETAESVAGWLAADLVGIPQEDRVSPTEFERTEQLGGRGDVPVGMLSPPRAGEHEEGDVDPSLLEVG